MDNRSQIKKLMTFSVSVYLLWIIATYLLEGRILTLLRPGAVVDRSAYTVTANILVGIIIAAWVLRSYLISGFDGYIQPIYPLISMALVSVIILVIFDIVYIRRKMEVISARL